MTRSVTVAVVVVTAMAGLAFAQRPIPPSPSPSPSPSVSPSVSPSPSPSVSPSPSPRPSSRPSARPSPTVSPAETPPDVELTATVHWRDLRFEQVGTPKVEFSGNPDNETVWHADRENLPTPVEPGVTYQDGGVRLVISSRFRELARALEAASPAPAASAPPSPSPAPSASPSPR
jgi:hypothetical protein